MRTSYSHANFIFSGIYTLDDNDTEVTQTTEFRARSGSPNIFVAILTARSTPLAQRNAVRQSWDAVDGGIGNVCYRFALCQDPSDNYEEALQAEQREHNDMLSLDCKEGYGNGLLTRKLVATMRIYSTAAQTNNICLNRELFMKTDVDTFVASAAFRQSLSAAVSDHGTASIYAGGFLPSISYAVRDRENKSFEPVETWPESAYPPSMLGGPGYILGRRLVQQILNGRIADKYLLYNEDKAVGVWISMLGRQDVKVNWIRLPVVNGEYKITDKGAIPMVTERTWRDYPFALHHGLSAKCITCLTHAQARADPNTSISTCFAKS